MNENRIPQLAGELARDLRALQDDGQMNVEGYIERKIREVLRDDRKAKELILERPLVGFDIESTGTDACVDRIIQLALVRIDPADLYQPEATETIKQWVVNPGRSIPEESTRIHGWTWEKVKDKPLFAEVVHEVLPYFQSCDLTGYNIIKMDVPMLWEEFARNGVEWDLTGVKLVDSCGIYHRKVRRDLSAALLRFCGHEHSQAHDAVADVRAAIEVLHGERAHYPDLEPLNVAGLAEFSNHEELNGQPVRRLDLCGYIVQGIDEVPRYTLKKARGVPVVDDVGFGCWMLRNDFPAHTKRVLNRLLEDHL
jgi:DNA polymerase-3 subunit epsilon